tara:strand:- start:8248 stop:9279 length:1032 start_codon:yes stop_codon:yes gene_type:complete
MRVIKQHLQLLLLGFLVALFGCSSQSDLSDYSKTFDNILTDQYIWLYGSGGIYWVSNEQVVLEAHVKNQQGLLDRGLYQVDVRDGSYLKVVDVPDQSPLTYKYCFDGKLLLVMITRGHFKAVNTPKGYKVEILESDEFTRTNPYSPLRCKFVEKPSEDSGYGSLRIDDGFIKHQWEGADEVHVYLSDEDGNNLKKLVDQKVVRRGSPVGMFTVKYYIKHINAYFGYSSWDHRDCTELWWLYRDDWLLKNKNLCLGEWAKGGSRLIHVLRGALYLEHYGGGKGRTYILSDNKELIVETKHGRGAVVSPNGCMVAYGEGAMSGKPGIRQKLKLFNYCEYQQGHNL